MYNDLGQCLDCLCIGFHARGCRAGEPDFLARYATDLSERADAAYRNLDDGDSRLVADLAQLVAALAQKVVGAGTTTSSEGVTTSADRLGLRQEWMIPADRGPGVQYLDRKPSCRSRTRWVTDWVDDE